MKVIKKLGSLLGDAIVISLGVAYIASWVKYPNLQKILHSTFWQLIVEWFNTLAS